MIREPLPTSAATGADATPKAPTAPWALRGLLVVAVLFLLSAAKPLLLPVTIAVVLTFVLSAPVRLLRRIGVPEALGAGVVVVSALSALLLIGSALATPAAQWWDRAPATMRDLLESLDRASTTLMEMVPQPPAVRRSKTATAPVPAPPRAAIADKLASEGLTFTRVVIGETLAFALSAAATVILLYFLLASEHWLVSRTVEAVQRRRTRALVLGGIRQAQREIGLFLGTQSIINLGLGTATGLALTAIGLPNPVLWAAVVAVLNFMPYLGPALAAAMLLLAGTMTYGTELEMFAPPAAFLALHAIEANFVSPMVIGRRLRLAPVSVFLSVMVWGWLWGIAGALIAVPLLLALRIVCKRSRRLKIVCIYLEGNHEAPPSLRSLLRKRRPST